MPKGWRISEDLRWSIVRMAPLVPIDSIALYTNVSKRQVLRILALHRATGNITTQWDKRLRRRKRHLTSDNVAFLHGSLNKSCDLYLNELKQGLEETLGVSVSLATVWRTLRLSGYAMKKLTRVAIERSAQKRGEYIYRIALHYLPEQLVFVDESAYDRPTTFHGRAWAIRGQRALRKVFFVRGKRYSILPGLSLDGILSCSITEGSFTADSFMQFIDGLLSQMNPFPRPNSVIVMDKCRIHKSPEILEMITARGMRYEFLPPYSPDFNPIELCFSAVKAHMRRTGDAFRTVSETQTEKAEILTLLYKAVHTVTTEGADRWFHHCGYF